MTTWLIRCFAFLLLMLPFVPAIADDPTTRCRCLVQAHRGPFADLPSAVRRRLTCAKSSWPSA